MSHRKNQDTNYALQEQYNPRTGYWLNDVKDILLRFLQDFFYQAPAGQQAFHFERGRPTQPDYSTEEKETELVITEQGAVNIASVGKRPAIVVSRGPFAYGNTSLDQLLHLDFATGKRVHTDLLTGSFVINCLSAEGLEAERLAQTVANAIRIYRRNLQRAGFFHIGALLQIGQETPAGTLVADDSANDWINVPVSLPVYYQWGWTVEQNAQVLTRLTLKIQALFKKFDGSLLVPDSVNPDGSINESSEGVIVQSWTVPPV